MTYDHWKTTEPDWNADKEPPVEVRPEPNIRTSYWAKPIPTNRFDWEAVDDDTYEGPGCPVGYGATEQEAVADLLEQIEAQS